MNFPKPAQLRKTIKTVTMHRSDMKCMDKLFEGFPEGCLIVVSGECGIGKTTLVMQVTEAFARQSGKLECMGINLEEGFSPSFMSKLDSLGIEETVFPKVDSDPEKVLNTIDAFSNQLNGHAGVVFVDSAQSLFPDGRMSGMREFVTDLRDKALKNRLIVFLVNHKRKDGALEGATIVARQCDAIITLERNKKEGLVLATPNKNRYSSGTFRVPRLSFSKTGICLSEEVTEDTE